MVLYAGILVFIFAIAWGGLQLVVWLAATAVIFWRIGRERGVELENARIETILQALRERIIREAKREAEAAAEKKYGPKPEKKKRERKAAKKPATPRYSTHWRLLGIAPTLDEEAVKKAFRVKILEVHPDAGGDENRARELIAAREAAFAQIKRERARREGQYEPA